ncbi:YopX family protein [Virgibacillus sp. C22-A2]|uniref:YopX family protein n=1 Tax=Virgibacillus tibetensis TaxID=3042313 RepID=A0ABU6K9R6_9BACI|nr:YopX family protein [Virgibacillus sp. C22-A2]
MREIKFRAWDNVAFEMLYVGEDMDVIFSLSDTGIECTDIRNGTPSGDGVDSMEHLIYMQFTGLHDKNGTPIYEGDIDTDENRNLTVVKYIKKYGAYCFVPIELYLHEDYENEVYYQYGYECFFHNVTPSVYAEVIGNIYEDKGLLE